MSAYKNPLPDQYLYQEDPRNDNEKSLSIKITKILSEINLRRMEQYNQKILNKLDRNAFYFICLCGVPPFKNQFENLDLPGDKTVLPVYGFGDYSEKQYMEKFKQACYQKQISIIRQLVQEHSKNKKVVLVYHSFGTFTALVYFQIHQQNHKISGIIDVGGAPIRYYPNLTNTILPLIGSNEKILEENRDAIFEGYSQSSKFVGINLISNKYETIIFLKYFMKDWFQKIFVYSRNLPDIPKLLTYGSQDIVFTEELLAEKIIYYTMLKKLPADVEEKYRKRYQQIYNQNVQNIQERFCVSFEGAKHSLHMQKKYIDGIKAAIHNYLYLIQ